MRDIGLWIPPAVLGGLGVFLWAASLLDRLVAVPPPSHPEGVTPCTSVLEPSS
jgi:hypothetical protein